MRIIFNHFSKQRSSNTREKEAKRANALILLKAIHNIDGNYVARNHFPFDLKDCSGEELPISEEDRTERIQELTYQKVQTLEKKNE